MQKAESIVFPERRTEHFLLRQIVQQDRPAIFVGLSHPLVIAHYGISYDTETATQEQIDWYRKLERNSTGMWWAICPLDRPNELVGTCGIYEVDLDNQNGDIGFWLLPAYWGKSIMQECLQSILTYAFQVMQLHRVEAEVETENAGSAKLLRKLGFIHEGCRREVLWKQGHFVDLDYFALLADAFLP